MPSKSEEVKGDIELSSCVDNMSCQVLCCAMICYAMLCYPCPMLCFHLNKSTFSIHIFVKLNYLLFQIIV